jgi:hypothetical protein
MFEQQSVKLARVFITRQLIERKPIWRGSSINEAMQVAIVCYSRQACLFQILHEQVNSCCETFETIKNVKLMKKSSTDHQ